jgi:hypothetical protein
MKAHPNRSHAAKPPMIALDDNSHPPDICLLLRTHSEQRWLTSRLVPVLADLEQPGCVPEDQLGAALAYVELLWIEARRRASETDAAHAQLERALGERSDLCESARAYHAAVRGLREGLHVRVDSLISAERCAGSREHAG